jgi:hypothetical protein
VRWCYRIRQCIVAWLKQNSNVHPVRLQAKVNGKGIKVGRAYREEDPTQNTRVVSKEKRKQS